MGNQERGTGPVSFRMPVSDIEALRQEADASGTSVAKLVALIVQKHLASNPSSVITGQARATARLLAWVETWARRATEKGWDDDVTLNAFVAIEREVPELYAEAAAGRQAVLNRTIGSAIRRALGAEVMARNGRADNRRPPAGSTNLIQSYTRLKPRSVRK